MKKAIVLSMLMFAVYACKETGDVGNAGGAGGGGGGGAGSAVQDISVKGTVLHSAFSDKDKVCFDRNKSKSCDDGEPSAQIATDGKYEIKGKASDTFAPLIAELSNTGSKLVFETPAEQSTISSITTIIKLKMDGEIGISLQSAEADVQRELGLASTTGSLFDTTQPDNIKVFAKTISETMTAMFAKLDTLGISTDKNSTFFVLAGISGNLSGIQSGKTPQDFVDKTIGTKDKTAIEGEIKKVADIIPSVASQSATDAFNAGLKIYSLEDNSYDGKKAYIFTIMEFSASQVKLYRVKNYKDPLPTTAPADAKTAGLINSDGSATLALGEGSPTYMTVETIKLDAKSLTSNYPYGNQKITFSTGAIMYKLNGIRNSANIDVDALTANGDGCIDNIVYPCDRVSKINENHFSSANYNIMMDDKTKTYYVTTQQPVYYWLFGPANTLPSGTYEKINGALYEFKNNKGIVVFKIYDTPNDGMYIAGWYDQSLTLEETFFNEIGAKDLQNQWDPNK